MIIALDGTASSGKGTLARRIAAHFDIPHLDTGLLYRAVGQRMLDFGHSPDDAMAASAIARAFSRSWLDDPRLRSAEAGVAASRVAAVPAVRDALREFQQAFARRPEGAVLDGRDIGTVIAPEAEVKLWITAAPEVRAARRYRELVSKGEPVQEAQILAELLARDDRDAPNMIRAADAVLLDTSALDVEGAFAAAMAVVERMLAERKGQRGG